MAILERINKLHYKITGKPDIVFPTRKIAIFINVCFWYLHGCKYSKSPVNNKNFWVNKLNLNKIRDENNIEKLKIDGWHVIVLWQCKLRSKKAIDDEMNNLVKGIIETSR